MLTPREIIAESWRITTTERTLRGWGFFRTIFALLLDLKLLAYQLYFLYSWVADKEVGLLDDWEWLYHNTPLWAFLTIIIGFLLLVLVELFIPSLGDGAIIGLAAKAYKKEKVEGGFILGLYNYFAILTLHEIFAFSGISIFITACSLILRYTSGLRWGLLVVATLLWIISSILRFFASFSEEGVVIQKLGVFEAAGRSIKLTVSYLSHIVFLALLMMVIGLRIVINAVVIIVLPAVLFGLGTVLTLFLAPVVAWTIIAVVGLIAVFFLAYGLTYLNVFKQTVWTIMFIEMNKQRDLDAIG
ncbi:MAG TPA: hypothetical protein PKV72_00510 [Candidatus Peribacteria bacterium]|nr:hypothetical protein [Candidatus Peribacteria bacterium]